MKSNISPLQARASGEFINVIIIGVVIIAFMFLVYLVYQMFAKKRNTPEWIEAQKKKPISSRDLKQATKDLNLTKDEKELLWDIGHNYADANILYIVQDADKFNDIFKQRYQDFLATSAAPRQISLLFALKDKMEKFYRQELIITSTKNIEAGQVLQFADKAGIHCSATIAENRLSEGLILSIPDNLAKGQNRPDTLSRVTFTFIKSGVTYALTTRVVRYQQNNNREVEMLISHTNDVKQLQRRQTDRVDLNVPCTFAAVRVSSDSAKKSDVSYTPLQTKYQGILKDVSSDGCSLQAGLPIREGQYIHLEFNLPKKADNISTGIIVSTEKSDSPGKFLLHIQFVKIEAETKNTILAMVNKFI